MTALLAVLHRRYPGLEGEITKDRLHDLGKMIFAFSVFWMYLFFSQYLVIWYGNLPEETQFFQARLGTEFLQSTWYWEGWWDRLGEPYVKVTLLAWICVWVIPFWLLLGQKPKRTWWFLAGVAVISALGFWLERNVLVWPSWAPEDSFAFLGWIQIGVALGFLGAFSLTYLVFTRVFPALAVPRRASLLHRPQQRASEKCRLDSAHERAHFLPAGDLPAASRSRRRWPSTPPAFAIPAGCSPLASSLPPTRASPSWSSPFAVCGWRPGRGSSCCVGSAFVSADGPEAAGARSLRPHPRAAGRQPFSSRGCSGSIAGCWARTPAG